MNKWRIASLALITSVIINGCSGIDEEENGSSDNLDVVPAPVTLSYQIINQFNHDTSAFTEGFTFHDGKLYESTGSPDSGVITSGTWIASIDLNTGKYDKKIEQGKSVFGEGITFLNGKLYQLTYRQNKGFIYDAKTFKKIREFPYKGEGWGLTNDGTSLIMSNGTSNLYYINPDSLNFTRMLAVQDNNGYVSDINELEYINGFIYANRWLTGNILKIDPKTGYVVAKMDLSRQVTDVKNRSRQAEEMNGIAYDSTSGKAYITGKKWPVIYEIKW
jgi:glutaminyl-peptide cyclotransferase